MLSVWLLPIVASVLIALWIARDGRGTQISKLALLFNIPVALIMIAFVWAVFFGIMYFLK
jgi:hypothetical protein